MPKIIAIDVGHCENVASYPAPSNDGTGFTINYYCLQGKEQLISSQIFLTNEQMRQLRGKFRPTFNDLMQLGDIRVDNDIKVDLPEGERFCYFKKVPPKDFDKPCGRGEIAKRCGITHGQIMACFIFVLVNNIFKLHVGNYLSPDDRKQVYLLIGCPATGDWEGNEYANLVKLATNVQEVHIVPESRAAMFSSVSSTINSISAVEGAVVFDFGSSTADCTYMLLGRKRIEFSYTLGASEIERNMTNYALKEAVNASGQFEVSPNAFINVENKMREMKEKFYSHQVDKDGEDVSCRFATSPKKITSTVNIDNDFMKEMTENVQVSIRRDSKELRTGSWRSLLREFFQEARSRINSSKYSLTDEYGQNIIKNCTINKIVLTGGASNMDFVYEECKKVFPEVTIIREQNTSYTVATGLSWVAVSDLRAAECINSAINQVQSDDSCKIETLRRKLSDAMFEKICGIVEKKTYEWSNIEVDVSAGYLKDMIEGYINDPNNQKMFADTCKKEMNIWKNELANSICDSVNAQAKKLFTDEIARGLMIPADLWKQLQPNILSFNNFDLSSIFTDLNMGGFVNQLTHSITVLVIWITAVAWAPATFGLSLIGGLFAHALADAIITDDDLNAARSKDIRERVHSSIREKLKEKKSEIMQKFNKNCEEQTAGLDEVLKDLVTSAFEIVTLKKF